MHSSIGSTRRPRFVAAFLAGSLAYCAGLMTASAQAQQAATPPAQSGAAPAAAPSDATKKAAREAYSTAKAAYEAGDYAIAAVNFSKANELIPSPNAQYWVAMSIDKQGKVTEAYSAFEAFFANPGHDALGEEKVGGARARFAELALMPAKVNVTTEPATAQLSVDDKAQPGTSPFSLSVAAGKHTIKVSANGYDAQSFDADVKPGQTIDHAFQLTASKVVAPVAVAPAKKVEAVPAPGAQPQERNKVPAYVTLGVAGAAAVAGTIFGVKALGAKSDFNKNPTGGNADNVERNGLIADMAFGVAVTLGITGIVLLTTDEPSDSASAHLEAPRTAPRFVVAPYVSPKSGGAEARLTF
ncbi:MAG TPA: PEGA domain-containing protein [Polyangiaceae bacterium]|nr:PEGA domain-containing protein [Polyangiaceae bacterium]